MTKEKQIEEMTIISCPSYCRNKEKKCANVTDCDCKCLQYHRGEALYNAGYRKASEVAREIFEEIDNILRLDASDYDDLMDSETVPEIYTEYLACSNYIDGIRHHFAELKKKYTEGER